MRGCDNYCTYCVVPYVRGRESSREEKEILAEIRHLVSRGVREVTLLGQNVNSFGLKEGHGSFPRLLEKVNAVDGLERIRFTTSHPKDLSDELIDAFGSLDKLCRHIHLPVQSGSNRILKRMNRRYTRETYLARVERLRRVCPGIAITSDIIVGFPGERERDYAETLSLIQEVGYDGLFAFIYSDRPNAPAVRFGDKVPEQIKKARLQEVLERQERFTLESNRKLIGTVQEILVDGTRTLKPEAGARGLEADEADRVQWSGRTSTNKIVHFSESGAPLAGNQMLTGRMMRIMIEKAMPHSLWGVPCSPGVCTASPGRGERTHVA
jgi:tRNA-2-methylthio-N6-dimethylallyladenosine synthase